MAATAAVATGVLVTLAVPFVALHELIVQRQRANLRRHLPVIKKRVHFGCERPEAAKRAPAPLPLTAAEEKALEAALVILPLPVVSPFKPALRVRTPPPLPSYEECCSIMPEETKVARVERPVVRFAQMA